MSNERDFENRDERVSEAYRLTAQERTPESLNQTVLGMASGKVTGRPRGMLFAAWTKPLAWAATIGLSLAIVLELTQVPGPMDTAIPPPASSAPAESQVESVRQDFERRENHAVEAAKALERMQTGRNNQDVLEEIAVADSVSDDAAAVDSVPNEPAEANGAPARVAESEVAQDPVVEEETQDAAFASFSADTPAPDQDSVVARSRISSLATPALEKKEADSATDCDLEARADAESWLLCIKELRKSGDLAAAEREYADFLLEYPDKDVDK